jgi:hypothetical protein
LAPNNNNNNNNNAAAAAAETKLSNIKEIDLNFYKVLSKFYEYAWTAYEKLQQDFRLAEKEFDGVVIFYGEDPKTTTPEEFFGIFARFCQMFTQAEKENEMAKAKVLEAQKKEAQQKVRTKYSCYDNVLSIPLHVPCFYYSFTD